jgi:hypothetical protein
MSGARIVCALALGMSDKKKAINKTRFDQQNMTSSDARK